MKQLVTPNPDIPCEPGWCLKYVRQAFGAPAVEPSATAGWENAEYKHEDYNFPDAWVPLWFSMDTIPEGHVVLRAPDGRIYSTSTNANTPYVHPNLEHLIWFYGDRVEPQYRLDLTYLGWSEDISNVRVVIDEEEDDMFTDDDRRVLNSANIRADTARSEATNAKVTAYAILDILTKDDPELADKLAKKIAERVAEIDAEDIANNLTVSISSK